jgi:hypothetical protein
MVESDLHTEELIRGLERTVALDDIIRRTAARTDSKDTPIEISSRPLGPGLPQGVMVAMNSSAQNFLVFRWQDVATAVKPNLKLNTSR